MQATSIDRRLQELLPELFEPSAQTGNRYLRFQLTAEISALLPLDSVREALQIAANQVTLLPNLPACSLGLVSAFNQVFCAIDLAQLLDVGLLAGNPQHYALIAIRAIAAEASHQTGVVEEEPVLGLAVHRIQGVTTLLPEAIVKAPATLPSYLAAFTQGASDDGALLLDVDALIAAPTLQA
ncbi:MAG: chemotaxis protein CheW [Cyanobacteria bacterium J06641_5]